jgi:hypothetical protein
MRHVFFKSQISISDDSLPSCEQASRHALMGFFPFFIDGKLLPNVEPDQAFTSLKTNRLPPEQVVPKAPLVAQHPWAG